MFLRPILQLFAWLPVKCPPRVAIRKQEQKQKHGPLALLQVSAYIWLFEKQKEDAEITDAGGMREEPVHDIIQGQDNGTGKLLCGQCGAQDGRGGIRCVRKSFRYTVQSAVDMQFG